MFPHALAAATVGESTDCVFTIGTTTAASESSAVEAADSPPLSAAVRCMIFSRCVRNSPNTSGGDSTLLFCKKLRSRFIRLINTGRRSTAFCVCAQVDRRVDKDAMWKSSGNTCTVQSSKYCWAITSLQATTCSRIRGSTFSVYTARVIPSSWESRTRLAPARILSSCLSRSRFTRSR